MENLSVKNLIHACSSLETAWEKYNTNTDDDFVRDSVIQRFEYSYALSIKYIQRYLELISPTPEDVDRLSFNNLIRTANEKGILRSNLEQWSIYRQRRNITSHTYNLKTALQVLEIIPEFIIEIKFLTEKIK